MCKMNPAVAKTMEQLKWIRTVDGAIETMRHMGLQEGREEGRAEGKLEAILIMLKNSLSISDAAKFSGLSEEEVRRMAEKLQLMLFKLQLTLS